MERVQCSAKRRKMRFTHSIHLSHSLSHSLTLLFLFLSSDAIVTLLAPSDWLQCRGNRTQQNSSRTQPYASRFDLTANAYYPILLLAYADHTTLSLSLSLSLFLSLSLSTFLSPSFAVSSLATTWICNVWFK